MGIFYCLVKRVENMNEKSLNNRKRVKPKKKLIMTTKEINRIKMISIIVVILIAAVVYYIADSSSYVATVDGNRISRSEFQFFLNQQVTYIEYLEELSTDQEKKEYWTTPVDGQDPWENAKSKALDFSKEYMIQLIKAQEMGLKVNSEIKSQAEAYLATLKGSLTDRQLYNYVKSAYGITPNELQKIYENLILIDDFKEKYMKENYVAQEITEADVKAYYDKDPKKFDDVDISYVSFYKHDDDGNDLTEDQLNEKRKTAETVLSKLKSGEDIDKLIKEYSEDADNDTSDDSDNSADDKIGKATLSYSESSSLKNLIDWVFSNKPGDSEIIETEFAIYVVKIEDRTDFEDLKDEIKTTMEQEAKEKFYEDALNSWSLESKYNIIKNSRVYDSISYK